MTSSSTSMEKPTGLDRTLAASLVASFLTRLVMHPMDSYRTYRQSSTQNVSLRHWLEQSKVWRGLVPSLVLSVPAQSAYLTIYSLLLTFLTTPVVDTTSTSNTSTPNTTSIADTKTKSTSTPITTADWKAISIAALTAELISGLLWTPMELMKSRHIMHNQHLITLLKQTVHTEGLHSLWKGYSLGLLVFVPQSVVYFHVYEHLKQTTQEQTFLDRLVLSSTAASAAAIVSHPLDTLRTRYQVQTTKRSLREVVGDVHSSRSWFRGMNARLMWVVPSMGLSMALFESFQSL